MNNLTQARSHTIQGLSRISHFWGFPKAMGAIFGALYLSPSPLSLDDLVEQAAVTKGAISTNVRQLERLGMVHREVVVGSRKDYYLAETDFWKIIKGILRERNQSEFDRAIGTVSESLTMLEDTTDLTPEEVDQARFYKNRLYALADFFNSLDRLVAMALVLDEFRVNALERFFRTNREQTAKRD